MPSDSDSCCVYVYSGEIQKILKTIQWTVHVEIAVNPQWPVEERARVETCSKL